MKGLILRHPVRVALCILAVLGGRVLYMCDSVDDRPKMKHASTEPSYYPISNDWREDYVRYFRNQGFDETTARQLAAIMINTIESETRGMDAHTVRTVAEEALKEAARGGGHRPYVPRNILPAPAGKGSIYNQEYRQKR